MTVSLLDRADLRQRVGSTLRTFLTNQRSRATNLEPSLVGLIESLESLVLGGGKRLRPAFAYWGYRGAGGADSDAVVATLAALELVQASALIHDDVMDGSETRRGKPSMHRRYATMHTGSGWNGDPEAFGVATAILLGDLCLVWSDELLHSAGLDPSTLARARPVFDEMRTEVTLGQYLDVQAQAAGNTSKARASLVAQLKSAKYTIERPLLIGGAIAGADETLAAAYRAYGLPLGEAFQLRDDVLGVFGDPAVTGKPAGDDLREGKRTYLVAEAVQNATDADRSALLAGLGDQDLGEDGVTALREIIVRTGALERTEERIGSLHAKAVAALDTAPVEAEARDVLAGLADAATRRAG